MIDETNMKVRTDDIKVGDRVHAVYNEIEGDGTIDIVDDSVMPYRVTFDTDGMSFWCYKDDVTKIERRISVGDLVISTANYWGNPFVATVVDTDGDASYVYLGYKTLVTNDCITLAKPKFNIGDKILNGRSTNVHTITNVRASYNRKHICYDTTLDDTDDTGTAFDYESTLYDPKEDMISKLKEELNVLKDASHTRNCEGINCDECPFQTENKGCLSNDVTSAIEQLKE